MTQESKETMYQLLKQFILPVIVAVVVGMGTAYLTAKESIAVQAQKIEQHNGEIAALKTDTRTDTHAIIRLEVEVEAVRAQLNRMENQLDRISEE